jgi:peroxidase
LNIQRGRDNGLASYNDTRVALGLKPATSFANITKDSTVQAQLQSVYGTVDKVDLWVGGLAEPHVNGGSLGQTFSKIIADQFQRLRDGDRFFYLNQFHGSQLTQIQNTTLADIISRNTTTTNLQANVFFFQTSISGQVTTGDARHATGVAGREIDLLDSTGAVIATTITAADGSYRFDQPGLGTYTVREMVPRGTALTKTVTITKGGAITHINFMDSAGNPWHGPTHGPGPSFPRWRI